MARQQPGNLVDIVRSYANDPFVVVGTCLLSAAMMTAAQTNLSAAPFSFLALVPICLVLPTQKFWKMLGILMLTYFGAAAMSLTWIRMMGPPLDLAMFAACVYGALFMAIPAGICRLAHRLAKLNHSLLLFPAGWMLAEILQRKIPPQLSWALLGMPLGDWEPLAQAASLFGPEFLSFIVVSMAVCLVTWCRQTSHPGRVVALALGPGFLISVLLWGQVHINALQGSSRRLTVGVVQPDVSPDVKSDSSRWTEMLQDYDELIDKILPARPYLLVFPDMAIPGIVREHAELKNWIQKTVVRTQRPLIFGTIDNVVDAPGRTRVEAVVMPPYGSPIHYEKIHLTPMAEYTPRLWPLSAWLKSVRGNLPERVKGRQGVIFQICDELLFGIMLGQEDIFPDLARSYANSNADLLVVLLNTRRFNGTSQYLQHTRRARLTAISVGLPMLRCNNSRASQFIASTGRLREELRGRSSIGSHRKSRAMQIPLAAHATLYRLIGDTGVIAFLVLGICGSLVGIGPWGRRLMERVRIMAPRGTNADRGDSHRLRLFL